MTTGHTAVLKSTFYAFVIVVGKHQHLVSGFPGLIPERFEAADECGLADRGQENG
jgi:hypothetical protein